MNISLLFKIFLRYYGLFAEFFFKFILLLFNTVLNNVSAQEGWRKPGFLGELQLQLLSEMYSQTAL